MDILPLVQSGGTEDHPVPQPPYPALSLGSTLTEILALGCDRSVDLPDGEALVEYLTPWDLRISWPAATPPEKASSMIAVHITARPVGGARIGIWQSQGDIIVEPPVISALSPSTAPANADIEVTITGTGFNSETTVNIGSAHSIVPSQWTATELKVTFGAVNIEQPATLPVSVTKGALESNVLDFVVT